MTYCQQRGLTVRERLHLFMQVCGAVEYSHRNLVVHRDLKAKNILVTEEGIPKLLDFGIAKLLDRDSSTQPDPTIAADRLFTPDYASPEQIRGESITTAADIYSLGVLLYEVLTERRPFQLTGLSHIEMSRIITEAGSAEAEYGCDARYLTPTRRGPRHNHSEGDAQERRPAVRIGATDG